MAMQELDLSKLIRPVIDTESAKVQPAHQRHWIKDVELGAQVMGRGPAERTVWKCCELCSRGLGHIKH